MIIGPTVIEAVKTLTPKRRGDARGWFAETWKRGALLRAGIDVEFVQDNESFSDNIGTLRGLHFQAPPHAQDKLVRVARGRILDVAVDLRRASPTYGRHVAVELSSETGRQLLVPIGFAHGFVTLEADTLVLYKVSAPYAPAHDHGLAFDDPALGIAWPFPTDTMRLSEKDGRHPPLSALPPYFA
ncbi:dTDP-4-dehydrorhamnose 3,5-epimerase [Aurantimonas sp. C2-6-R+9]|uniref:dTDP-4-dehydrorhamnose 3,5-epimerase n=1 Tax=unclassified Aurantimonas TaxID=2638230 RepID=UPI002E174A52|nr:dTDP-4-dehydrorhamnose 3,5-epimerase [Aurantimonas sp. C2-6-R+9]